MAKAFISYKRSVEPDDHVAHTVCRMLEARGHTYFIDRVMAPGTAWAQRLEKELADSDWLVLLLSEHSVQSEMVRAEVEMARRLAGPSGKPRILPIRVSYRHALPYPLSAYLDGIQWAFWDGEATTGALAEQLALALEGKDLPLPPADLLRSDQAAPAAPFAATQPVGGVRRADGPISLERPDDQPALDSVFYVERASDKKAVRSGSSATTITLRGPRQMGKTALLNRLMLRARRAGKRIVYLDFKLFDVAGVREPRAFLEQFCAWFASELDLEHSVEPYWSALPLRKACTKHVVEKLLGRVAEPVFFAADEVDRLFESPARHDFLAMLRVWHESRNLHPALGAMDMVLVTSTEPEQFTRHDQPYGSPFNVGTAVELVDFSPAEVDALIKSHELSFDPGPRRLLGEIFGGHPYLTRKALYLIADDQWRLTDATSAEELTDPFGPFGDHLRHYLLQLQPLPDLAQDLRAALAGKATSSQASFDRLRGAGLLRGTRAKPQARCQLYGAFFRKHFDG